MSVVIRTGVLLVESRGMIGQLYPSPQELERRRWGVRTYDPTYYLYQHIEVGDRANWLDPKPRPFSIKAEDKGNSEHVYSSRWGKLDGDLIEKFANHRKWTSTVRDDAVFIPMYNRHKQPPPKLHPLTEPIPRKPLRYGVSASEWQQVQGRADKKGLIMMHVTKAWPSVTSDYRPFPLNVGQITKLPGPLKHGRNPEEAMKVISTSGAR